MKHDELVERVAVGLFKALAAQDYAYNWDTLEGVALDGDFNLKTVAAAALAAVYEAVKEPTPEMVAKGWLAAHRVETADRCNHEMLKDAHRAMLAASPLNPEAGE
jgi:hypothetical protein